MRQSHEILVNKLPVKVVQSSARWPKKENKKSEGKLNDITIDRFTALEKKDPGDF